MADNDAGPVITSPIGQPPVNGYARLSAPDNRGRAEAVTEQPVWPSNEPVETGARLPDPDARLLRHVFLQRAMGEELDVARGVRDAIEGGHKVFDGTLAPDVAAEGRRRARADTDEGRTLRAAGMEEVADYLDAVNAGVEAAGGFPVLDRSTPGSWQHGLVAQMFDALQDQLRTSNTAIAQPPTTLAAADIPLDTSPRQLRHPDVFRRQVHRLVDAPEAASTMPADVRRALGVLDGALMVVGHDVPAREWFVAGMDPQPLHVAARVDQIADIIDSCFRTKDGLPDREAQRGALGTYDQQLTLADYLRTSADDIRRRVSDPAAHAVARVVGHLDVVMDRDRTRPGTTETDTASVAVDSATVRQNVTQEAAAAPGEGTPPEHVTPYRYNPELRPEHALLGSLLNTPRALDDISKFLGPEHFSTPDTRTVFAALLRLHKTGSLFDVAALTNPAAQLQAAERNQLSLYTMLKVGPTEQGGHAVSDVSRLIGQITAEAPLECVPYKGGYDPGAQMRIARMVLEDSIRRSLNGMGVTMERATPMVRPPLVLAPGRGERVATELATRLEGVENNLVDLSKRLAMAVQRTGPDAAVVSNPAVADEAVAQSATKRPWRIPERLLAVTEPLLHRAERHILHLALYAGKMEDIPAQFLNLTPEDFSSERHANMWRTIKDLQAQGLPVNHVAVDRERGAEYAHRPMLSGKAFEQMRNPPEINHRRIARSLRTVVAAALSRAKTETQYGIAAVNTDRVVPVEAALVNATQNIRRLAERTTTAVQQHQKATQHQQTHTRTGTR